jgi:two-component system, OmpR family, KDP operon response regulator KdpE
MTPDSTILVIDDDEPILQLMRSLLRQYSFRSLTASSGREALEIIRTDAPDLILLDLGLPDMAGEKLLEEIHRISGRSIPVVILSGHQLSEEEWLQSGAVGALQKPFEVSTLIQQIRQHLSTPTR